MSLEITRDVARLICGNVEDLRNCLRGPDGENRDLLLRAQLTLRDMPESKTKANMIATALRKLTAAEAPEEAAPTPAQIYAAFAACRSIRFAVKNSKRFGGEFSLTDILAADRLAQEALEPKALAAKSETGGAS